MKEGQIIHRGSIGEIIKVIDNKIYECTVDNVTAKELMGMYPVINVRQENGTIFLRLAADKIPCESAVPVQATLEDLYLYYFSEVEDYA